jgi:methylated-DNA-[protein]-cysteine S-methyltransferase
MSYTIVESPIGDLTLTADASSGLLTGLYMVDHRHRPALERFGEYRAGANARLIFGKAIEQLGEYFNGERRSFDLATQTSGTPFQRAIWAALLLIPYGETATYAELAQLIGRPTAVRAAGAANGRNPISIIVPCHRVIGADGSLTGFGGGIERKHFLLQLEQASIAAGAR